MSFQTGCVGACVASLALMGAMRLDDQSEAKPILQRALKAMGDPAKLEELKSGVAKGKVTGDAGGQELTATFEGSWRGLDHYRIEAEISHGGQNATAVIVISGNQGWAKFAEKDDNPPDEVIGAIKNALYAMRTPQFLVSLTGAAYKLSPTGEDKVGDKPVLGVRVSHKDFKDVSLFFDKESGLLVKSAVQVTVREGKEVPMEFHYVDYKDFDGIKQPSKVTIKAQDQEVKEITMQIDSVVGGKQLPDSTFEKP